MSPGLFEKSMIFTKINEKKGPKWFPWGATNLTSKVLDTWPISLTYWKRPFDEGMGIYTDFFKIKLNSHFCF